MVTALFVFVVGCADTRGRCRLHSDCGPGMSCLDRMCVLQCRESRDCPFGERCNLTFGLCVLDDTETEPGMDAGFNAFGGNDAGFVLDGALMSFDAAVTGSDAGGFAFDSGRSVTDSGTDVGSRLVIVSRSKIFPDFYTAREMCESRGMHLPFPLTIRDNDRLAAFVDRVGSVWIGVNPNTPERFTEWTDGSVIVSYYWVPGYPIGPAADSAVALAAASASWNNTSPFWVPASWPPGGNPVVCEYN